MFCSKCGSQVADNVAFCPQCGNPLAVQTQNDYAQTPNNYGQTQNSYAQTNYGYQQAFQPQPAFVRPAIIRSSHPVLNILKSIGASPLYLVAIISFSVCLLFRLVNAISGATGVVSYISDLLDMLDIPSSYFSGSLRTLQGAAVATTLLGMVPTILMAVGMWLVFSSAVNTLNGGMKTTGLTMIKVISIINMVFCYVFAALFEVIMIIAVVSASNQRSSYGLYSSMSSAAIRILIAAMVIGGGIFALVIIYQAKIIRTINTMKNTILTGIASDKVSIFVAVLCFIYGGIQALSIVQSNDGLAVISVLASVTALICFGILLFSYKNKMRMYILSNAPQQQNGYAQPAVQYDASQNVYQQQAYQQTYQQQEYQQQDQQQTYQQQEYQQQDQQQAYQQQAYQQQENQQYYARNETGVMNDNNTQY